MESEAEKQEIGRIEKEYARREKEIAPNYYSLEQPGNFYIYVQRLKEVLEMLKREKMWPLAGKKILEIGCGAGQWLADFEMLGAEPGNLHGVDLLPEKIERAKKRLPAAVLHAGEAAKLPWPAGKFDLILQSTVFTSILDPEYKVAAAKEMLRVLKPGGVILWYDFRFNNPWNPNVKGIEKKEIAALFPGCSVKTKKLTLAPPIARTLAPVSWILCLLLEKISLLRTHYLAVIRK